MSFSAFNVGRQVMTMTSNKMPQMRFGSKPVAGGSFTPSTLEAAFVMRSSLDYQFEKAFNDKYKAMMQNRLNELTKRLQEAYTDLLNTSMAQQIGQEGDVDLRADVKLDGRDGTTLASLLEGVAGENGFEDLGVSPKTLSRDAISNGQGSINRNEVGVDYLNPGTGNSGTDIWRAPGIIADRMDPNYPSSNQYADDGMSGYGRRIGGDEVQFRTLLDQTSAGGTVTGEMHITMRTEEDPPIPEEADVSLDMLNSVTSAILGGPADPTYFNQKLAQYSTTYKTGGFWSAVNYLYNFAPREIKYTYAVAYTVNTDEAGNDEYLINGELVDDRDIPGPGQAYTDTDNRLKWASFDPTEGYTHERSGTYSNYPTVINRAAAWVDGTDNSANGIRAIWDENFTDTEGVSNIVENLIFQSGTYKYDGTFINNTSGMGLSIDGTVNQGGQTIQYSGSSASGLVSLLSSNIQVGSTFTTKVDMTNDDTTDVEIPPDGDTDFKVTARGANRSSLFYNHYEVETRTVEFNNSARKDVKELWDPATDPLGTPDYAGDDGVGKIYAFGGIARSYSIDAGKSYEWVDTDVNNVAPDSDGDGHPDDYEISRNSGNVNNTFNGEFIQGLHKITSVNGQNIVGNDPKQASPIIGNFEIGKYEGLMRSEQMSRNIVSYIAPPQMDIDASNAVPTDWYQSEMLASEGADPADPDEGFIWFPFTEDTLYSRIPGGTTTDDRSGYGRLNSPKQVIQTRNTFQLSRDEYMTLQPATDWVVDASGVRRPTYEKKDYIIQIDLRGIDYNPSDDTRQPILYVNGKEVSLMPPDLSSEIGYTGSGSWNFTKTINLKDYLQEGYNSMVIQTSDAQFQDPLASLNYQEGVRIISAGTGAGLNDTVAENTINAKIITGYNNQQAVKYSPELTRVDTLKVQSRWQSRVVPTTTTLDLDYKLASMASTPTSTGSSYKVANSFVELIIDMINQQKYRDIFRMGLMSNLNKLAIQGQANLPNGASMQGSVTMYYDNAQQRIVLVQDKLIANS